MCYSQTHDLQDFPYCCMEMEWRWEKPQWETGAYGIIWEVTGQSSQEEIRYWNLKWGRLSRTSLSLGVGQLSELSE